MSYDINFWRYKPGISLDHQEVYEQLSDGKRVEGLEDLPIREMLVDDLSGQAEAQGMPSWRHRDAHEKIDP